MKEVKFNDLTLQVHKIKDSINQNIQNTTNDIINIIINILNFIIRQIFLN